MISIPVAASLGVPEYIRSILRCPACRNVLSDGAKGLHCTNSSCDAAYPVVRGIPILLNAKSSLFDLESVHSPGHAPSASEPWWRRLERAIVPSISKNWMAERNYDDLFGRLRSRGGQPLVLVIGGSTEGEGLRKYLRDPAFRIVESDIYIGPRTNLVSDANDIPFAEESVDAVIIQAVLEYLPDPDRVVKGIHRVLKSDGFVYSETPFMAQVHGGAFDFNRYTHLGHRRLFRRFAEISSGPVNGPGMALAWSYKYFLLSFFTGRMARNLAFVFAHFTAFWLKYLDGYLIRKPGTFDCALGFYFLGRKSAETLSDGDLVKGYRGLWKIR